MKTPLVCNILKQLPSLAILALVGCAGVAKEPAANSQPGITLRDFKLVGDLSDDRASFTLDATATVENSKGGTLDLVSGVVALTGFGAHPRWDLRADNGHYIATFDRSGEFPVHIKFTAAVTQNGNRNDVDFHVAPAAVQPITLQGLAADTQFEFAGAARPERSGNDFKSYLPADGAVKLSWKQARKAEEGKLFYATEMLSQISVSPGLMRQTALLDFKVMQGELSRVTLLLRGGGEVTRVQGDPVLAWNVEPANDGATGDRHLVIQLNQSQKDSFTLQIQLQTPLGAFPQAVDAIRVQPEGATRFAGYFRIANEGAVRLEVAQASGLSQISPEQFPETDATRAALRATGSQRFAYRFSSAEVALRVQADQIQPELTVSEVLAYHHGQNELAIDAEFELDVREAPLRELQIVVPRGYAIARLNASGMSDYFLSEPGNDGATSELRIIYGQPVSGRQIVQLRLEHNKPLGETNWILPRIEVAKAKSVRGNIGISADTGFRLNVERSQALTEISTAFFPRKVVNLQTAFRLNEPGWEATLHVERLPQTVQVDGFHLFSIGEGVAYGSSVMNYSISGAPISAFRVELSDEYFNVEFTGKDVSTWQKTTNGYVVQLHSPVAGAYTLLATYERPFRSAGETLAFTGARPLDAQNESGHTLVISAYQFQVKPVDVSSGLMPLETAEVPAEYRLFFDAPILAAYRYTARPFNLKLALSPLDQGKSQDQIVDRASFVTHISKEGQALTDVTYLVKNRGNPNFRLTLPDAVDLWSATINNATVVPVKDPGAYLIPLPQGADPNAVLKLDLKLASKSADTKHVVVAAPSVNAPVMLAEWKIEPDAGQRLEFVKGSLRPAGDQPDVTGFGQLTRIFRLATGQIISSFATAFVLVFCALVVWRWASREVVYKFNARHVAGAAIGLVALVLAGAAFANIFTLAAEHRSFPPANLSFLAPVQQAGSAWSIEVENVSEKAATFSLVSEAALVCVACLLWIAGFLASDDWKKVLARIAAWLPLAWAALRLPNGAPWFLGVVIAFIALHVLLPALRRLWRLPVKPATASGTAPAAATLVLLIVLSLGPSCIAAQTPGMKSQVSLPAVSKATDASAKVPALAVAESIAQEIRVEDEFVFATARIRWLAEKGAMLPLLIEPAVLTRLANPKGAFEIVHSTENGKRTQQLIAQRSGTFDIEAQYELRVAKSPAGGAFALPTPCGLMNRLDVTVMGSDVDVYSPQAVSVRCEFSGSNSVATLLLSPSNGTLIGWKPRSRDVKREKAVFYVEISQLYAPSAGVIEGAHLVAIRPAHGELSELSLDVPRGATVTDVTDVTEANPKSEIRNPKSLVSLWRFDPDTRKLRVTFSRPQSKPFTLLVHSQVATGTLPFEESVGLLSVDNAANQIGVLGIATGNEVQLDSVTAENFSPINLEDFPNEAAQPLAAQIPSLTVRRAFRYADIKAIAKLKASPVEPDVRVEAQDTLSLGEDRTVLASTATVDITRAGIFKLSFIMPAGFDVEAISGAALSHWTESKSDAARVITLNLRGKTEGRQQFTISLAGPGIKASRFQGKWAVPQIALREAGKQQGTLLVVPEQGMQLQAATMEGLSQLDPQRAGIRQKGVLTFRVLQSLWQLALDIEQVDPWIQVTSLQHATVTEARVNVAANLQYQIENTGLKSLHVSIPTNAESVRFAGEHFSDPDFGRIPGAVTNGLQRWEIKLQRRVIGPYGLQVTYQTPIADAATETVLRGIEADEVNLQRGFVTIEAGGRVQVKADATGAALQPSEWQSIPRALQQNLPAAAANFAFRLAEPGFELPLKLDRHEAVKLLPARVNNIAFTSVISDSGAMLTQVRLEMQPGDKRLLAVKLPKESRYWFAFVNQNGVWPWRDGDDILIPLEQQSRGEKPVPVEIFYSGQAGEPTARKLDLNLLAPKFDLPLENISWRVFLNEKWQLKNWTGTLQLASQQVAPVTANLDLEGYTQKEAALQREKTQEAEEMLAMGNSALENGNPQQARRAFQAAYGLSTHDNAFNEDARVQLHNLKLQQALVGLNVRQAANSGESGARMRILQNRKDFNYTQQDAKDIIDGNSADDNAATMKLAEKLIQQQDAAVASVAAMRANIPEQGRMLAFERSVAVDQDADLRINLNVQIEPMRHRATSFLILVSIFAAFALMEWWTRALFRAR